MLSVDSGSRAWQQTLTAAASFWAACLLLVIFEATVGSNAFISVLFFFSIPLLVAWLTWVNLGIVYRRWPRQLWSVFALGAAVLGSATLIILVGLVAAAKLKHLLIA